MEFVLFVRLLFRIERVVVRGMMLIGLVVLVGGTHVVWGDKERVSESWRESIGSLVDGRLEDMTRKNQPIY